MERVLLHCDMNNYFASVEEKHNPALKAVPIAVCGDPEMRHSIVVSANRLAKKYGVCAGISFYQARQLCPDLRYVVADYGKILAESKQAREIYRKYTGTIIPYGLDESWIDLTETGVSLRDGAQIADLIRMEIRYAQGLSASVGVSDNLIFSKLGSDMRKPDATTVISRDNYRALVWPLPASDLLFVGRKRAGVLARAGIRTIGDLAGADPRVLHRLLGKVGCDLWQYAHGDDRSFHPEADEVKSIANKITLPADVYTSADASATIYLLSSLVSARLQRNEKKARCIGISLKDNQFREITRQCSVETPIDDTVRIFNQAFALFSRHFPWTYPLRAVGVRADSLLSNAHEQYTLISPDSASAAPCADIDERVKDLIARTGQLKVEVSAFTKEWV